jgi:hypothetical protein
VQARLLLRWDEQACRRRPVRTCLWADAQSPPAVLDDWGRRSGRQRSRGSGNKKQMPSQTWRQVSNDIGACSGDQLPDDLYVRWIQRGAFCSIVRVCCDG